MPRNAKPEPVCRITINKLIRAAEDLEKQAIHLRKIAEDMEHMANVAWGKPPEASEL